MTDTELQEIVKAGQVAIWRGNLDELRNMLDRAGRVAHLPVAGELIDRVLAELPKLREWHQRIMEG